MGSLRPRQSPGTVPRLREAMAVAIQGTVTSAAGRQDATRAVGQALVSGADQVSWQRTHDPGERAGRIVTRAAAVICRG